MPIQTWDGLQKNATTDTTIEQFIADQIALHEADPEAHLGVGESLEAHKTADVIDHPAYSVVDDKIKVDKFNIESYFDNLSCFGLSGSSFNYFGYAEIYTTTSLNATARLSNNSDDYGAYTPDRTKNPIFEFVGMPYSTHDYEARFGMGDLSDVVGVGFKAVGTTAYAMYYDDDETVHTITLSGVNPKVIHKWRIEIIWEEIVVWFVDNVQVASLDLTTNTINLQGGGYMFLFWIKNLSAGYVSHFSMYRVLYQQDLFTP